jgi:hypothetical protein
VRFVTPGSPLVSSSAPEPACSPSAAAAGLGFCLMGVSAAGALRFVLLLPAAADVLLLPAAAPTTPAGMMCCAEPALAPVPLGRGAGLMCGGMVAEWKMRAVRRRARGCEERAGDGWRRTTRRRVRAEKSCEGACGRCAGGKVCVWTCEGRRPPAECEAGMVCGRVGWLRARREVQQQGRAAAVARGGAGRPAAAGRRNARDPRRHGSAGRASKGAPLQA